MANLVNTNDNQDMSNINISIKKETPRDLNSNTLLYLNLPTKSCNKNNEQSKPTPLKNPKCHLHQSQSIIYLCSHDQCDFIMTCSLCSLDDPSHLSQHKSFIYPINEFFTEHKYSHLEIKLEKELDNLVSGFVSTVDNVKTELKNLIRNADPNQLKFRNYTSLIEKLKQLDIFKLPHHQKDYSLISAIFPSDKEKFDISNKDFETQILIFVNLMKNNLEKNQKYIQEQLTCLAEKCKQFTQTSQTSQTSKNPQNVFILFLF